jgi:hypothetical protein
MNSNEYIIKIYSMIDMMILVSYCQYYFFSIKKIVKLKMVEVSTVVRIAFFSG